MGAKKYILQNSTTNYAVLYIASEKLIDLVDKIEDLRKDYQNATAKKGLQGADALQSDEYKEFRKQSNDLKIMLSTAMEIMTKDAGATGQVIKPNVTPGYTAKVMK